MSRSASPRAQAAVRRYLRAIDVPISTNSDAFWRRLSSAAGQSAAARIERAAEARQRGQAADDVYGLVHASRASTRASAQMVSPMLKPWMEWWADAEVGGSLLDLGCGAGIYACFMAQQHPDVAVVGVDGSEPAIEQASTLADELRLDNVTFIHADVSTLTLERQFDVVSSTALLTEMEAVPYPSGRFRLEEVVEQAISLRGSSLAAAVAKHLAPGGRYVSIERLSDLPRLAWWIGALQEQGLQVDLSDVDRLDFEAPLEGRSRMPVVVARRAVGSAQHTPVSAGELIERAGQLGYTDAARTTEIWLGSSDGVELLGGALMGAEGLPSALLMAVARDGLLGVLVAYDNGVQHCAWEGVNAGGCESVLNDLAGQLTEAGFRHMRTINDADVDALRRSA